MRQCQHRADVVELKQKLDMGLQALVRTASIPITQAVRQLGEIPAFAIVC
jgi:hypothetical protein